MRMLLSSILAAAQLLFTAGCEIPPLAPDGPSSGPDTEPIVMQEAPSSEEQLTPDADTYVAGQGDKNTNFGADTLLLVEKSGDKRSLARWNLAEIADAVGNDSLVSAELVFTITENGGGWGASGGVVRAHPMSTPWTEEGATWSCADDTNTSNNKADCIAPWGIGTDDPMECTTIQSGDGTVEPPPEEDQECFVPYRPTPSDSLIATADLTGEVTFEVTEDVRDIIADEIPGTPYREGWLLRKADDKAQGSIAFGSRESANPPRLILTTEGHQEIPEFPPDSLPSAIYNDSSYIVEDPACRGVPFMRSIVTVTFVEGTTHEERQAAVDHVNGTVVGGVPLSEQGIYILAVEDDATGAGVCAAEAALDELPTVEQAAPDEIAENYYRQPRDGANWQDWQLDPDAADGENWALEAIDAPRAWGCETGSTSVPIMTIDDEIHVEGISDLEANLDAANSVGLDPPITAATISSHGTGVASMLAAAGNNDSLMTGVMWNARLQLRNYGIQVGGSRIKIVNTLRIGLAAADPSPRVLVLPNGAPWPATFEPAESDSDDVERRDEWHQDLRRALVQTTETFNIPMPLIVIAAGNDGIPAKWSGFANIKNDFPNHVLVVGASTPDGSLWSLSNSGPLVETVAPGAGVFRLEKTSATVEIDSNNGTSLAAPMVAGVAGLLASFDPGLSTAEIKDLILEGADRGGREAGGFRLLNAYEALKAAAERDGAPLCGNRVWATDSTIVADRGDGGPEVLANESALLLGQVGILHGGKYMGYFKRNLPADGGNIVFVRRAWPGPSAAGEVWPEVPSLPDTSVAPPSGTHASVFGDSHGRDTAARIDPDPIQGSWFLTEDSREVPVNITVGENGTPEPAGKIVVNDLTEPVQQTCIERNPNDANACVLTLTENRAWLLRLGYPQYPDVAAPNSRKAMVTVNPLQTLVVSSDEWTPCGVNTSHECRRVDVRQFHVEAEVATLDLKGGAGETPVPMTTLPDESVFWIGQSENGGELVLGTGEWLTTWEAHADNYWTNGTPYFNGQQSTLDCRIEYRDRSSFSSLLESIPTLDACEGGTIAYPSIGSGGGTIAPSVAPSIQGDTGTANATMLPIVTSRELESSS